MDRLLTVRGVAALLEVSVGQVWKLHSSGRLPGAVRISRSVRWRADELSQWVDAGCPNQERWNTLREASRRREINGMTILDLRYIGPGIPFLIPWWLLALICAIRLALWYLLRGRRD